MPIPALNPDGVLPPFVGDPTISANSSPYPALVMECGLTFGMSADRRLILDGWLNLRQLLRQANFGTHLCFQWVAGSFTEDIELTESRSPRDVDIITFYWPPSPTFSADTAAAFPVLADHNQTKTDFLVDHYFVDLSHHPEGVVELVAFWCGLFSHRRDGVRKGLLKIDLGTNADDDALRVWMGQQP